MKIEYTVTNLIMKRSGPSVFKFPRLTLRGKRKKKEAKRALQEQMEKEEAEQDGQAQEKADLELAVRLGEESASDSRSEEAEVWEHKQTIDPSSNPLLLPRDER